MKAKSIITTILALAVIASMAYAVAVKKPDSESEKYKDWVLYINKDAGFSIMIPEFFEIYEDEIKNPKEHQHPQEIIFASKKRPERPGSSMDFYTGYGGYAIVVNFKENPKSLTLEEWLHPKVLEDIKKQKNHEIEVAKHRAFIAHRSAGETDVLDVDFVTKDKYFNIYLIPFFFKKDFDRYPQLNRKQFEESIKNLHLMLESFKLLEK